ncbi:hypothetical protein TVAG_459090 [Trichomonas vaginalis G3]|uniref:Thioredoxin domain-containing protein n=1 Tax=Trichomonas vaginalis (strain ATCC PRA-98 / G3) TaxID=412133 RepID=A2E6B4_TRIV3|nr:cell redox homeostasis [Trichomonas vaginalis G3]EAY11837.1 hypothetical protein TVAG_459090 [Trichomonas vaginalis G3]KAI5534255.1 cell redox homeostasis [Trichomonas vaginalis G3]|eukprot:XP_001324060.1 hypothetical protein [Trichomonas vaginalis G3]
MAEVITFNGSIQELNDLITGYSGLSILDLNAAWCSTCKRLSRKLPALAEDTPNTRFIKIDIDDNPEIKVYFGVDAIPSLKFLKGESKLQALDSYIGDNIDIIKGKISKLN